MVKEETYIFDTEINKYYDEVLATSVEHKLLSNEQVNNQDIETLLDYVVFSARSLITSNIYLENYVNKSDMCQSIICDYLNKLHITNYPNMTEHSISNYIAKHHFVVVSFNDNINYILDPTYRSMLISDNCKGSNELIIKNMRVLSPDPGFYIKNPKLIKKLVNKGYIPLNEATAKIYGDSFYKTKTNIPAQFTMPSLSGKTYIHSFLKANEPLMNYNIGEIELLTDNQKIR